MVHPRGRFSSVTIPADVVPSDQRHEEARAGSGQWAAVPKEGFHTLRHTYASVMWEPESPS
ncbi:hypothetical protein [Streptomyces sp. NBC_00388]|uniref:hypothetical protein n=1 Tax=Streptomyces sp. NBC_00388 TaxID=2975735 RepID=UPI002E1D8409